MRRCMTVLMTVVGAYALANADDTIAFYTFKDVPAGSFTASVADVTPGGTAGPATATRGTVAANTVFSSDAPGKYIYAGSRHAGNLVCTAPGSFRLGSGACGSGNLSGSLTFPGAAKELSKCHATGSTFEFFFKMNPADKSYRWNYQTYVNIGYRYSGDNAMHPVRTMIPYPQNPASDDPYNLFRACYWGEGDGPYKGSNITLPNKIAGFTSLNDGKWHHFAQVETNDGSSILVRFYIDYTLVNTITMSSANVTAEEYDSSTVTIAPQNGSWNAAISCVRFSRGALDAKGMLHASDREGYDDDVIAFYPFLDGEAGRSCVGDNKALNDVAPDTYRGSVTLSTESAANPSVTYDAESPGAYIYNGKRTVAAKPFFVSPRSLHFTSDDNGKSASVSFAELAGAVSECHSTGSTVEFFVKFDDGNTTSWEHCFRAFFGYVTGGEERDFRIYLPYARNEQYKRTIVFSFNEYVNGMGKSYYSQKELSADFTADGEWHHVAIVERPAAEGKADVEVWFDYASCGKITADSTVNNTAKSLNIGRNVQHAKYSCVRVMARPLDASSFLKAYNSPPRGVTVSFR